MMNELSEKNWLEYKIQDIINKKNHMYSVINKANAKIEAYDECQNILENRLNSIKNEGQSND